MKRSDIEIATVKAAAARPAYLRFFGLTKAVARIHKSGDGFTVMGPASVFKLAPIERLAEHCTSAIAIQTKVSRAMFLLEVGLQVDANNHCSAVASIEFQEHLDESQVERVVTSFLSRLKVSDARTPSLLAAGDVALSPDTDKEIDQSVHSILCHAGGSPVSTPCNVLIDNRQIASFGGMYRAKPDLSQLVATDVTMAGKVDGFRLKKRCLFFETEGKSIQIFWELDQLQDLVLNLARDPLNMVCLTLKRTLDRTGSPLYSLVSLA